METFKLSSIKRRQSDVVFTNHSIKRFSERFKELLVTDRSVQYSMSIDFYKNSKVDASIINNTALMVKLYDAHGYDPMEFRISNRVVYVIKGKSVVTVYDVKDSIFNQVNSRFRK